eukprot:57187_1
MFQFKSPLERWSHRTQILLFTFILSFILMIFMFCNFPSMAPEDKAQLKIPRDLSDVKILANVLSEYQGDNNYVVMIGFCALYLFLQTFAIPGTLLLSILSGCLFPWLIALILVTAVQLYNPCTVFVFTTKYPLYSAAHQVHHYATDYRNIWHVIW